MISKGAFLLPPPAPVVHPDHPRSGDLLQLLSLPEAALFPGQQARSGARRDAGRRGPDRGGGCDAADHRHQDAIRGGQCLPAVAIITFGAPIFRVCLFFVCLFFCLKCC